MSILLLFIAPEISKSLEQRHAGMTADDSRTMPASPRANAEPAESAKTAHAPDMPGHAMPADSPAEPFMNGELMPADSPAEPFMNGELMPADNPAEPAPSGGTPAVRQAGQAHHDQGAGASHYWMDRGGMGLMDEIACGYCQLLIHLPLMVWVCIPFIWRRLLISRTAPPAIFLHPLLPLFLGNSQPRAPPTY